MRILFLSPVPLDRSDDGCKLRGIGFVNCLRELGHEVEILHFADDGGTIGIPRPPMPGELERFLSPVPSLLRCFRSKQFAQAVRLAARRADACFFLGLQMAQYASCLPREMPTVVDNINVESDILLRLARRRVGPKRLYWLWQAAKLWLFERWLLRKATYVVAISDADGREFARFLDSGRVRVIPPGLAIEPHLQAQGEPNAGRLVFVGALNWHVNIEAAEWMTRQVLPLIQQQMPEVKFDIVGKQPDPKVRQLAEVPGVDVHSDVPEVVSYLRKAAVVVVPLRYGSGVQNKVVEGLAAGRPVVTTSIGLEGLDLVPGRDLWVADDPEEFARHCLNFLQDSTVARAAGERGRALVSDRFNRTRMRRDLDALCLALGAR